MASTPPVPAVSPVDAAREAFAHTRRGLFPLRLERWLVLGFLAFLDQCGRSLPGGGGSPGAGGGHGPHGGGLPDTAEVAAQLQKALEWLSAHAAPMVLGGLVGLITLAAVVAVVLWVNSRGVFAYLDAVATGRAELSRPWRRHALAASSYFGWSLGITLAAVFVVVFAAGLVVTTVFAWATGRLSAAPWLLVATMFPVLALLLTSWPRCSSRPRFRAPPPLVCWSPWSCGTPAPSSSTSCSSSSSWW
jgi:hypothetical protein